MNLPAFNAPKQEPKAPQMTQEQLLELAQKDPNAFLQLIYKMMLPPQQLINANNMNDMGKTLPQNTPENLALQNMVRHNARDLEQSYVNKNISPSDRQTYAPQLNSGNNDVKFGMQSQLMNDKRAYDEQLKNAQNLWTQRNAKTTQPGSSMSPEMPSWLKSPATGTPIDMQKNALEHMMRTQNLY